MSLLDSFKKLTSSVPGLSSAINTTQSIMNAVQPVELTNLGSAGDDIERRIAEYSQTPTNAESLIHLRTFLMSHFRNIRNGAEPAPDMLRAVQLKAMPQYAEVVAKYEVLQTSLQQLELEHLHAVYGYKLEDGSILSPNLGWSDAELADITQRSATQTARCWSTESPERFIS